MREGTSPSMRLASLSQRFFSKGEEQEASGYKDVVLDDDASSSELEFDSFDRIPRRRRPLLAITALLVSLPVIGYVTWKSTGGFGRSGPSVKEAARLMVTGHPAPADMPASSQPAGTPSGGPGAPANAESSLPAIVAGTCQPPATGPAAAAPVAPSPAAQEPAREATPVVAAAPRTAPPAPPAEARSDADLETRTEAPAKSKAEAKPIADTAAAAASSTAVESSTPARKTRSSSALRGYVWSAEANALVPAGAPVPPDPSLTPITDLGDAPATKPSATRAEEPRVAPAPRIAAPRDPGAIPTQEPRIAPPPRIAAPETGPMPAEKAPIIE